MTGGPDQGDAPPTLEDLNARAYEGRTSTCGKDNCNIPPKTDAETAWEKLMAPVTRRDVEFTYPEVTNQYYFPDESTFNHVLEAVRPPEASENHAMRAISADWQHVSETQLQAIHDDLHTAIRNLSNSWEGDDFDGLSDTMDETLTMIANTQEKVDTVVRELNEVADGVEAKQGLNGDATPFPPAQLYLHYEDDWCCDDYKLHIRPPWGVECEIRDGTDEIAEAVAEEGGSVVSETREWIQTRTNELIENDDMNPAEAERQAREEAMDQIDGSREEAIQEYVDTTNVEIEDIMARASEADQSVDGMRTGSQPETPPPIADEEEIEPSPGAGAPPAGSAPSVPGMDGFDTNTRPTPPTMPDPGGPTGPGSPTGPGGLPDYDTGNPPGGGGLDDDNPWGGGTDPDDIGGGLASGGGGGVPSAGAPPGIGGGGGMGAGAGAGAGAGGMGMMGAGGMGAGRGAGAAGGRGAGGRGAGAGRGAGGMGGGRGGGRAGGMGGMMGGGGGRGGVGAGEGEGDSDTWLTEEDDVWGIGNEDDDPYA